MSTVPSSEACAWWWSSELPPLAAADLAMELGWQFGEAALTSGEVELALAWARAFRVDTVNGRPTALGHLARAARDVGRIELARQLLAEAFACARHAWHRVELILDAEFADDAIAALVRDHVIDREGGLDVVELAWYLARARLLDEEETPRLAIVTRVLSGLPREDQRRCAVDAALWLVHARRRETQAAADARQRVLDAVEAGLDIWPMGRSRAVIAAALAADELLALAPRLPWMLTPELVAALVRGGAVERALALPYPPAWLPARLARTRPDDPRAAEWIASAEASEAVLAEQYAEGLITSFEHRDARLELAAMRGRSDPARALAGLVDIMTDHAGGLLAGLHATRTSVTEVGAGEELELVGDEKWSTPGGERMLARALTEWCDAPDWPSRYRRGRHGANIFAAATTFALAGDRPRALALMQQAFVDDQNLVALLEPVQPTLVTAWLATGQVEQALGLAWAKPLSPVAVAPLIVELAAMDEAAEALKLLGPALTRAKDSADLRALAPAVLAVADDRAACAQEMLAALSAAEAAIAGITTSVSRRA
ncbi:hypothetical protein [Nannocystis radixulma]|uniref:Uncharacterized protein n=1 Tax=Nannocystis radixulma TaxID=2995305 RepID=A0ABT5BHT4_9BACT|nr:hypothetical protein [Nannocystis radixulma]MDC0672607.1 hypothetical protein [Nannocystis radixulma]